MSRPDGISHLVEEGIIDAVHTRLMSGKEATVYVVEREGHLGAAKVYKARDERTFKKTASYVRGGIKPATRATAGRCRRRAPTGAGSSRTTGRTWSSMPSEPLSMPACACRSRTSSTKTFYSWS